MIASFNGASTILLGLGSVALFGFQVPALLSKLTINEAGQELPKSLDKTIKETGQELQKSLDKTIKETGTTLGFFMLGSSVIIGFFWSSLASLDAKS